MIISAGFVAAHAILLTGLAIFVSVGRLKHRISLGDGGNKAFLRRQRAHGNSIEHATVMIPLVILYEMRNGSVLFLALVAGLFLLGRILHAFALIESTVSQARRLTAALSYLLELVLAVALLISIIL